MVNQCTAVCSKYLSVNWDSTRAGRRTLTGDDTLYVPEVTDDPSGEWLEGALCEVRGSIAKRRRSVSDVVSRVRKSAVPLVNRRVEVRCTAALVDDLVR